MSAGDAAVPGWRDVLGGGGAARFGVLTGGVALHAVSIYVVATIMPVVVGEIGGLAFFAWTATLYLAGSLTGAAAVPGLLSRAGPRAAYRAAFAVFATGSLVCSLAPDMAVLLAGRLLQGFGGGMLPALAYGTIRAMFRPALHARAIAMMGSVWGIAAVVGPSVGGAFAAAGAWRAAFWVDLAVGLAVAVAAERVMPAGRDAAAPVRRFQGGRLGLLALAAMAVGAGGVSGRTGPSALGIAAAAGLVAIVLRLDRRAPAARLLPRGAFDPRQNLGAVSGAMGLLVLSMSPCNFVPYLLRAGHGAAPIVGGYAAASIALAWTIASLLAARLGRRATRAAIAAGPALMLAGVALDGWALAAGPVGAVIVAQLLIGAGIGVAWPHLGALMMAAAAPDEREIAGPFITTTQTLASAFGSALAGMLANLAGLAVAADSAEVRTVAAWLFGASAVLPLGAWVVCARALRMTAPGTPA